MVTRIPCGTTRSHLFRELNDSTPADPAVSARDEDDLACEVLGEELLATPRKGRHDGRYL